MEVKINKEIRDYTESMFFGLSIRQFFFSLAAIGIAVVLYLTLKPVLGLETVSWLCIIGAVPFAAMGFVKYHGMNAEEFLWAWLRSELIEPRELRFESSTIYYEAVEQSRRGKKTVEGKEKEKDGNEDTEETAEAGPGTVPSADEGAGYDPDQVHME